MEQNKTPINPTDPKRTNKLKLVWGLICLIGPSALFIASLLLYAGVNLLLGSAGSGQSTVSVIVNVSLYIVGLLAVLTWLPGIVIGIILLATRKKVH